MLRPSSDSEAQGPSNWTRHNVDRSSTSAARDAASSALASGSSDTVTLVSEVDTRSTDRPWRLKTWKASARKPTWCHMPGLSMDTSVMPLRNAIALTCAPPSAGCELMTVPGAAGLWVAYTCSGMPRWRTGRMQRGCSTLAPLVAISCASS